MGVVDHAKREFLALGYIPVDQPQEDGPNKWIQENILQLLEVFAEQGHSGTSSNYCIDMFSKLAKYEPLCPLIGDDAEWNDVSGYGGKDDPIIYQNNRCSHVFKEDETAWDSDGYIFWHWCERQLEEDEEGYPGISKFKSNFTSNMSRRKVEFPYVPKSEYIEVECFEVDKGDETPENETPTVLVPGSGWWHTKYPQHILDEHNANFPEVVREVLDQPTCTEPLQNLL